MTTAQELFDTIVTRIIAQGRASTDDEGNCMYRSPDGCVCAAGAVITDEEYMPEMEKLDVYTLRHQGSLPERLLDYVNLLQDMQEAHDLSHSSDDFVDLFAARSRDAAFKYCLSPAAIDVALASRTR